MCVEFLSHKHTSLLHCCHSVGKAGGSTVGCSLGFSLHCSSDGQTIPGLLPVLTTHTFHRGVYDCTNTAAYYLFVVRDPLARVLSAFNYNRPDLDEKLPKNPKFHKGAFYFDCQYWTLEEMAQKGLLHNDAGGGVSEQCQEIADLAVKGVADNVPHWYFNYQYYYQMVPENARILVIRNEHIVDDYNSIESMLGGKKDALDSSLLPVNNSHETNSTDLYLSDESIVALCRALCNEIQMYKTILHRAENFNADDLQTSMDELEKKCPKESTADSCTDELPDITKKIEERKVDPIL